MDKQLEEIRNWAKAKIADGQEPPWAWFQYMKLIETVDAILASQACIVTMENSPQSDQHQIPHLQLVEPTSRQDNGPPLPGPSPIRMPM
jgi:hypothetical protein